MVRIKRRTNSQGQNEKTSFLRVAMSKNTSQGQNEEKDFSGFKNEEKDFSRFKNEGKQMASLHFSDGASFVKNQFIIFLFNPPHINFILIMVSGQARRITIIITALSIFLLLLLLLLLLLCSSSLAAVDPNRMVQFKPGQKVFASASASPPVKRIRECLF